MILGIGTDTLDSRRLGKVLDQFGERFINRCFTDAEREKAERRRDAGTHIDTYAKRFAAKEACAKALGTGFAQGVYMKDIGVVNAPSGKPDIILTGGALKKLQLLTPHGKTVQIHLTLTDEPPMVQAQVIIEAI